MSIRCEDRLRARRRFRAGLLECCLGMFLAILLGLATLVITPGVPTLASITSTSPMLSAQQGTRGANTTKGANVTKAGTRAAGPCIDKTKRYVDCGNGTVTDTATGVIWLKQWNCLPSANWEDARKAVAGLKNGDCMLTDGSSPGDWRLPTQMEWEAAMEKALAMGCSGPTLLNDAGTGCMSAGPSSFTGVESDYFWSSTPMEGNPQAVLGDLDHGNLLKANLINTLRVWPVRGGQR